MKISIDSFFETIEGALRLDLPFTAYRYPGTKEIKGFFQKNKVLHFNKNFLDEGFIFSPFDDKYPSILFPLEESKVLSVIDTPNFAEDSKKSEKEVLRTQEKVAHLNLVRKGLDFLKTTGSKKVVLSRQEIINVRDFNALGTFKKLLRKYSRAMVYIWFHPEVGLWLGASPETLLKVENDGFTTMALAGTQPYQGSLNLIWEDKEKQEQKYVTDYIVEKLTGISTDTNMNGPHALRAGSLVHLCTTIQGKISQNLSLEKLVKILHPTPAICGMPKKEAKQFILDNENYNRSFYTGYLGEININSRSNLFVNLRCMQVFPTELVIYVGGGITADSNPEKEWEETVAKSAVMLKAIG